MAKSPIFDTSSIIEHSERVESLYYSALFPSIVFFELIATSTDESTYKKYSRWHKALKKADRILTPTENDWWETARMIRRMYLGKIAQETKLKTLRMDALIARLAVKNDGFVVTVDVDDFELIKRHCRIYRLFRQAIFLAGKLTNYPHPTASLTGKTAARAPKKTILK